MRHKIEELQNVLNQYEPFLKVWSKAIAFTGDEYGYIEFSEPKGKNCFVSIIKEFPLEDVDKIIEIYKSKVDTYESEGGTDECE